MISAKRMQLVFGFKIRLMCFLWGFEQPQANRRVIEFDLSKPFLVFSSNPREPAFVVFAFAILSIFGVCGFSEIAQSVVCAISVYVVYLFFRPFAVNVQPNKTMSVVENTIDSDTDVSVFHLASGFVTRSASTARHVPCENTRTGVIVDKGFEPFLGQVLGTHDLDTIKQVRFCQP